MNKEQQRKEFEEWLATVKYDNSHILSPSNLAWEAWQAAREQVTEQRDRLADLVKQFIYILDITEESDSGRLFHPTNITSCRAGDLQKIGELVEALRRASRTTNQNEL
jgi:hypothetical protein